jgi:hypothetical protein
MVGEVATRHNPVITASGLNLSEQQSVSWLSRTL